MDLTLLDRLARNQSRTLEELRTADRATFNSLVTAIGSERRRVLADAAAEVSPDAAAAITALDPGILVFGPARAAIGDALTGRNVADGERERVLVRLDTPSPLEPAPLPVDVPLARIAAFQPVLARASLAQFARRAQLDDEAVSALVDATPSIESVSDAVLTDLAARRGVDRAAVRRLGLQVSLHHLADGDAAVATALAGTEFPALGRRIGDLRDLARVPAEEIAGALRDAQVDLGARAPEDVAASINKRARNAYPEVTPTAARVDERVLGDRLSRAAEVINTNRQRFGADFDALDLSGVPARERDEVQAAYRDVVTMARRYPRLGLESIILQTAAPRDIASAIARRVAQFDRVVEANRDVEPMALDYSPGSADVARIDMLDLDDADRQAVLASLKARQRVHVAVDDPDDALRVREAGYEGSIQIASDDLDTFQRRTGLPIARAKQIHRRAEETATMVLVNIVAILDLLQGYRGPTDNVQRDVSDALRQIEGYADMFGSQDYCNCEHCSSILGPAAYFVDLMYFVEQHVLAKVFVGPLATHALNLSVRRPDLWALQLTCANTSTPVPTLDIINEILESYLAKARNAAIDVNDRAAVQTLVYRQVLPQATRSLVTPFVLPVFTADVYVQLFETRRGVIARALGAPEARVTAASLEMSRATYNLCVGENLDLAYLRRVFRVSLTTAAGGGIAAVDVKPFLRGAGITHSDLEALTRSSFVSAAGANALRLVAQKSSPGAVQNDIERIVGLNPGVLDRMHRLLRLAAHTGWTLDETDLVLEHRVAAGAASRIDPDALRDLAAVRELTRAFALPVDVACALWSPIPTREVAAGARSLFDRLFNNRPYTLTEGTLPQDGTRFIVPAFRTTPRPGTDNTLQRLLLGLEVDDAGLTALVRGLAGPLGVDPAAAAEANRGFLLTRPNLTLLYRHRILARLLGVAIADLFRLMSFAGVAAVTTLRELQTVIDFEAWFRASGLSLDDVAYITGGDVQQDALYADPAVVTTDVIGRVAREDALAVASTALAFISEITEDLSRQIFADNAALFDVVGEGRFRLKASVAADAALATPPGMPAARAAQVRAAIMRFHTAHVLPAQIATSLRVTTEKLTALAQVAGIDLGSQAMRTALLGGARDPLQTAVTTLARLVTLFRDDIPASRLSFLRTHAALFGVTRFDSLRVPHVQTITRYHSLIAPPPETTGRARDPQAVDDVLAAFTAAQKFGGVTAERLGAALAVDAGVAATLRAAVTVGNDAIEALAALAAVLTLVEVTRLDVPTLTLLASEDASDLAAGSEALVSALVRLYPADNHARLEPKDDRIRSAKRDALADYIIRESDGRFDSLNDLYEYFLLDVQLQGCARTSRVIAGISSLQAYVHRILLNLEQDRRDPGPTRVHILPDRIPADEWDWRKNYRVWEANRKVFLWPENYIEPALRDDKTPLFRTLEDGLLQQDINEQNVLDAYGAYLAGFEAAAGVTIAGAYHEFNAAARTDVLHLFGATKDDPPEYYYWTITNLHHSRLSADRRLSYSARRKMEVSIPTRAVTAVVYLGRLFVFWTETATNSRNQMTDGDFTFAGYKHQHRIKFTSLRLDGRWTAPQSMSVPDTGLGLKSDGSVLDLINQRGTSVPFYATEYIGHAEPQDGYTLVGPQWTRVALEPIWSNGLVAHAGGYAYLWRGDLFDRVFKQIPHDGSDATALRTAWGGPRRVLHVGDDASTRRLYAPTITVPLQRAPAWLPTPTSLQHIVCDIARTREFLIGSGMVPVSVADYAADFNLTPARRGAALGRLRVADAAVTAITGSPAGAGIILSAGTDAFCVLADPASPDKWMGLRIGSTFIRRLSRTLFVGGVDLLLHLDTQKQLGELFPLLAERTDVTVLGPDRTGQIDFDGALGVYFREVFFHIPFLIANHLNGRQNYRAAQSWYHYLFDPTAPPDTLLLSEMTEAELQQALRDRVWRYIQFRGLTPPRLREILSDDAAIEAYKKDPFNPHAIARSRLSAYQKSVVMKYVTNLMDWGDSLFSQFTTESINEATVLYVLASQILGERPATVGACGEAAVTPRTYPTIRDALGRGSEFLLEVETRIAIGPRVNRFTRRASPESFISYRRTDSDLAAARLQREADTVAAMATDEAVPDKQRSIPADAMSRLKLVAGAGAMTAGASDAELTIEVDTVGANQLLDQGLDPAVSQQLDWKRTRSSSWEESAGGARALMSNDSGLVNSYRKAGHFARAFVRQIGPVFCVPPNKDLARLWTRVEDRLYKIRHCLDITGASRQPALLAPEIDPRLLVRAKAAGLSFDDLLAASSGNLPPYRFAFLIDKAKQFTSVVQGFGAQLLGTLEKRDVELLARLRNDQQMNVLRLTTRMREWDVRLATYAHDQLVQQKAAAEFRRDYYTELINTDLLPGERAQQLIRHMSTEFFIMGAIFGGTAGVVSLIPTLGAPTSIKYGGTELSRSMKGWSAMFSDTARLLDVLSASVGLEASFERRREGWDHQKNLAIYELKQIERQIAAAELRVKIAERALEMHQKSIDEQEEIMEFFRDKFSNAGRYLWLSTSLQRLYREAFNAAQSMARLAERAYRFERDDEVTPLLQATYWTSEQAGLTAGEALMTDLLDLERRFVETNYRTLEIDQSFSAMQIAPAALVALRENGECDVAIPEIAFDLFYPGHYRRRIRAVRVTIPCVTGPYTNVGATLTLKRSFLRRSPEVGAAALIEVPLRHTPSVATSTAQNDAGVFDFSFRDERYMPFEGAGAISTWTISLPKNFRPFDYRTITDVVLHVSYTALADSALRNTVESTMRNVEGSLMQTLRTTPLPRAVSLRQEFSSAFQRAMTSAPGTEVTFDIDERFLPIFLRGRSFQVGRALLLLRTARGATGAGFAVTLGGTDITTFGPSTDFPGHREANALPGLTGGLVGRHVFTIESGGDLVPTPAPVVPAAADPSKLADLILYVELTLRTDA